MYQINTVMMYLRNAVVSSHSPGLYNEEGIKTKLGLSSLDFFCLSTLATKRIPYLLWLF